MLLQTNSYIVPREKREEHARLVRKFRQVLHRLGCDDFEIYEQIGANWNTAETTGRYVQIMRFRDRKHQQAVQAAEREDRGAQTVIREFCELINFPYQQQQGLFASGFYQSVLPTTEPRRPEAVRGRAAPVMPAADPTPAAPGEPMEPVPAAPAAEDTLLTGDADSGSPDVGDAEMGDASQHVPTGDADDPVIDVDAQPVEGDTVDFDLDLDDDANTQNEHSGSR